MAGLASERVERRLTAILAVDVAGYSRLMGVDEVRRPPCARSEVHGDARAPTFSGYFEPKFLDRIAALLREYGIPEK